MSRVTVTCEMCKNKFLHIVLHKTTRKKRFCEDCLRARDKLLKNKKYQKVQK